MSDEPPVDFHVQPSPAGGFNVVMRGADSPLSHHNTEEEARERRDAYARRTDASTLVEPAGTESQGEHVVLRDGSEVWVRQVVAQDKPLFVAGFAQLSEEGRRTRFFTAKKALTAEELTRFTELDHRDAEALGAIDPNTGVGVGVARYERLSPGSDRAESALTVVDAWQRRGLGSALLGRLARRALENGVAVFVAGVLVENHAMRRAFETVGSVRVTGADGGVLELEIELSVAELAAGGLGHVVRALRDAS